MSDTALNSTERWWANTVTRRRPEEGPTTREPGTVAVDAGK